MEDAGFGFRFLGKIPEGKLEIICECGEYIKEFRLMGDGQPIVCLKCNRKFQAIKQETHWHLFINK